MSEKKVTRKEFLSQTLFGMGALGSGLFVPELFAGGISRSRRQNSGQQKHIVIIGAGLAGLSAAWELKDNGYKITILEARDRPGGRVSTVRDPFESDLYVEEGGVAFSETYTLAKKYIEKFGLQTAPWALPENPVYHLRNERFTLTGNDEVKWPYELTPEEQQLGPMGIVQKYIIDTLPPECSEPRLWDQSPLVNLDKQSLADYLRSQGASEGAIQLLKSTQWFAAVPEDTSALSMAVSDFGLFMGGIPFVLIGGNDQLPYAMAAPLEEMIHYDTIVEAITEKNDTVMVSGNEVGKQFQISADQVICTMPAPVLNQLHVTPGLPQDQQSALREMPYLDYTRTYLQIDRAYWQDAGVSGVAFTDLPVGQVNGYPGSDPASFAVMESMVSGPSAKKLAALPEEELLQLIRKDFEKVFPGFGSHFHGTSYVKSWGDDPYALGGPSFPAQGDVTSYLKVLQRPHGRIHFAGEHTSILRSTMEGALRSGVRAAREII